jgi:acyl carrier protein
MFEKLKDLIVEQLDVDADKVTEDANIQEDLGADSLDVTELIMAIEDEFDLEISDSDAEGIKTVGDIIKYLEANQ